MKKIFSFIAVFTFVISVLGQVNSKSKISIESGVTLIPFEKNDIGSNYKLGYHGGINYSYSFNDKFSLFTGLNITQKKQAYTKDSTSSIFDLFGVSELLGDTFTITGFNDTIYENTNGFNSSLYLELPILAKFKVHHFNFYAGPYVGLLLNNKKKEIVRTEIPALKFFDISSLDTTGLFSLFMPPAESENTNEYTSSKNISSLDYGAIVGIGYQMDAVEFKVNYSYGFRDYRIDSGNDDMQVHQSIRITINYWFNIPKPQPVSSIE
ncbi:MAG: hypothetical protein Kow0079_10670 [Vicingaceae bacterium]